MVAILSGGLRRGSGGVARVLAAGLMVLAAAGGALADQITLVPVADNTMYSESGVESNGAGNSLFAGLNGEGGIRRGLVRFDLSAIPPGSTVTAAQLTLYCSRTRTDEMNVGLHRVLASWGEGTSHAPGEEGAGGPAAAGDATWSHRFYNTVAWAAPGGEFVSAASATLSVDNQNRFYTWTSAGLAADVQAWVDAPTSNHGWMLRGNEAVQSAKRFESREGTNTSRRPMLVVTFTPAGASGACCLPGGACLVTTQASCAGQGGVYQGDATPCTPNPCPQPTGACCLGGGACVVLIQDDCLAQEGVYQGNNVPCDPSPCVTPSGACCFNDAGCEVLTEAECLAQGGAYQGNSTPCSPGLCPLVLEKYVDALMFPPVAQPISGEPGGMAEYVIPITAFTQQLHRDLPPTRVYGYAGSFPGPTFIARRGLPIMVTWINDLRDAMGNLLQEHELFIDPCLHGPDEFGTAPRTIVHLHGGLIPQEADGFPDDAFPPGQQLGPITYPNDQPAALIWYHDHALGITRLNVMMGMAGGYIVRDEIEDALGLPGGEFEVPLVIQDRSFKPDGSFDYPAQWQEHFFGDVMLVNGKVWPYLSVKQGKYRFRAVNGCNSRTLTLGLSSGQSFQQIGTDTGLKPETVTLQSITISPGERCDLIVDFAGLAPGTELILTNSAPAPFPGEPGVGELPEVMKFIVTAEAGFTGAIPQTLAPVPPIPEAAAVRSRDFILRRTFDPGCNHDMWLINDLMWDDITEFPRLGSVEIWSWINRSGVTHPMHMHLVAFQVLDRQDFDVVGGEIVPVGERMPPHPSEVGWKDTVQATPNQITRVITRFEGYVGRYPYHCHILEHEDHEMMRQFQTTCAADWNTDLSVNSGDISAFLTAWLDSVQNGNLIADFNGDLSVNSGDISAFLTAWLASVAGGC